MRRLAAEAVAVATILAATAFSGAARVEAADAPLASAVVAALILGLGYGLALWGPGSVARIHLHPWLTLVAALVGQQGAGRCLIVLAVQLLTAATMGYVAGILVPLTFAAGLPSSVPEHVVLTREGVAAFGFVLVALGVAHRQDVRVPLAVGAYASACFWFTNAGASGNPLTLVAASVASWGRGAPVPPPIGPAVLASGAGAAAATVVALWLFPTARLAAARLLYGTPEPERAHGAALERDP